MPGWRHHLTKRLGKKMRVKRGEVRLPIEEFKLHPAKRHLALINIAGDLARRSLEPLPGTSLDIREKGEHIVYRLPQMPRLPGGAD